MPEQKQNRKRKRDKEEILSLDYLVGRSGKSAVRELLRSDPNVVIPELQRAHGLNASSANASLRLLGQCGVGAYAIHSHVYSELSTKLLSRIPTLSQAKLLLLLEACFGYLNVPALRAVPVAVLSALDSIPHQYLAKLAGNSVRRNSEFSDLPLAVRQQAWEHSPDKAYEYLRPIFAKIVKETEVTHYD